MVQANSIEVAEMRMLRWTCGKTLLDMIPNGSFRRNHQVATVVNKMREGRLRWFGHVKRRPQSAPVRRVETIVVDGVRRRGRPKLRWKDTLKTDLKELLLSEDMTSDRNSWRTRIREFLAYRVHALLSEVFLEVVPLSLGRGVTIYIPPPPYLALAGLGTVVVVVVLWALKGVETIDVATGQKFNMRVMVLWTINDFPARTYVGHRRFLKKPHKWRRSLEFNGKIEDGDHPRKFNRDQIQAQLARLPTHVKGKHPSYGGVKIKCNVLVELDLTRRSIFYELEYWSFLTLKHNLDIMHIQKYVLKAILNTLLMNDKSKDTAKARQDLKRLAI
ncbi:zinc finger, PHD-type containing protein [Tanacetum coccineum]